MVSEMNYPQLERAINPTHDIKLFSGRSNPKLAQEIADYLGTTVGPMVVKNFADGEIYVQVKESVRGDDVFIIQPVCNPVNENLMELLIIIDAFKRASAKTITAVIPYYGYARQDRKTSGREAITAKLVADLLTTAGATRVLAMDLHTGQIQGFFNILVDHIFATNVLVNYVKDLGINPDDMIAVSPDMGGANRTRHFAKKLGIPIAIIDKRRDKHNEAIATHRKQPDLNWENPQLREEVYKNIRWWMEKGIGGFRIDAIINIKKPAVLHDYPADRDDGLSSVENMLMEAEGIGEFLGEMRDKAFAPYDAFTVGEVFNERRGDLPCLSERTAISPRCSTSPWSSTAGAEKAGSI